MTRAAGRPTTTAKTSTDSAISPSEKSARDASTTEYSVRSTTHFVTVRNGSSAPPARPASAAIPSAAVVARGGGGPRRRHGRASPGAPPRRTKVESSERSTAPVNT